MLDIFKDSISHLWVRNEERERHHDHDSVRIADSTEIPGNPRIIQGLLRHCNECTWFCKRVPAGYRVGNDHRTAARGLKEIKHVSFYAFNVHLWSTLQCLTVSQSICWYCCDRGGCGAQIAILCLVRGVIPGLRVPSTSWNWTALESFQGYGRILFKLASCTVHKFDDDS